MRFKQQLNCDNELILEYTQHPVNELIAFGGIPLDPGMMDRLGFLEKDIQAYHLTNKVELERMAKDQNKNKHLSCFTKYGSELARLPSQPDVLLTLVGDAVISGETDLWSLVSTRDRRWLDINSDKHSKLAFKIKGVLASVVKKRGYDIDVYNLPPKTLAGAIVSLTKKEQITLYRDYLKSMENMLNSGGYKELNTYLKTAAEMQYNEIILTKWKIIEARCINSDQEQVKKWCAMNNITYGKRTTWSNKLDINK